MQTCFIYSGELLCTLCGNAEKEIIRAAYPERTDSEFSDHWPQKSALGESDTPDHCAGCGCFLGSPLTHDGYAYVQRALDEHGATGKGNREVLQQWARHYGFHNAGVLNG